VLSAEKPYNRKLRESVRMNK